MLISDLSYLEVVSTEGTDVVGGGRRGRRRGNGRNGKNGCNRIVITITNTVTPTNNNTNTTTSDSSIPVSFVPSVETTVV